MAGATMGGPGTIYDPREKAKEKKGKKGYWPSVQADLNKQAAARAKGKSGNSKKIGR